MQFFNAWTPLNSLDLTSFLAYAFKALYFIFFKDPVNNCFPYKCQEVHFQIAFKKTCCTGTFAICTKDIISGPFYEQANLPINLH